MLHRGSNPTSTSRHACCHRPSASAARAQSSTTRSLRKLGCHQIAQQLRRSSQTFVFLRQRDTADVACNSPCNSPSNSRRQHEWVEVQQCPQPGMEQQLLQKQQWFQTQWMQRIRSKQHQELMLKDQSTYTGNSLYDEATMAVQQQAHTVTQRSSQGVLLLSASAEEEQHGQMQQWIEARPMGLEVAEVQQAAQVAIARTAGTASSAGAGRQKQQRPQEQAARPMGRRAFLISACTTIACNASLGAATAVAPPSSVLTAGTATGVGGAASASEEAAAAAAAATAADSEDGSGNTAVLDISSLQAEAYAAYSERRFQDAVDALTRCIAVQPREPRWWEMRAQALVDGKNFGAALEDYATAAQLVPGADLVTHARLLAGQALAAEGLGRWEAALADYQSALQLAARAGESLDPYILNSIGNCLNSLGRWQDARDQYLASSAVFQAARGFRDRNGSTTSRLDGAVFAASNAALMRAQLGDTEGAVAEMVRISRRAPGSADMRAALAALYWGQGRRQAAEEAWEFACDQITVGCSKYSDLQWLAGIRRWPPVMVAAMADFLALR